MTTQQVQQQPQTSSTSSAKLIGALATRYGVEPQKLMATLKTVVFKPRSNEAPISNEELMALAVVANEYQLNPFLKEIYAFRGKTGALMPLISVDGWLRILNRQSDYDGMDVKFGADIQIPGQKVPLPEWCEVSIFRKGLAHPVIHREYMVECLMDTDPWRKHPRRMLKHRAVIQGIRYAFGVSGAFDEDSVKEADSFTETVANAPTNAPATYPVLTPQKLEAITIKAIQFHGEKAGEWIDQAIHPSQREQAKRLAAQLTRPKVEQAKPQPVVAVTAAPEPAQTADDDILPSGDDMFLQGV